MSELLRSSDPLFKARTNVLRCVIEAGVIGTLQAHMRTLAAGTHYAGPDYPSFVGPEL